MGNLGPTELLVILAIALLVFGPKKLPEFGRGIGQAMKEFKNAQHELTESVHSEMHREEPAKTVSAPVASIPVTEIQA
jgi:sec-independent protein translocase protein TatA